MQSSNGVGHASAFICQIVAPAYCLLKTIYCTVNLQEFLMQEKMLAAQMCNTN